MAHAQKITTSRDLALLAGVSHVTISRAFRADLSVRPETRERILALARQHGYRPNAIVSLAMRTKRRGRTSDISGAIAFLHSNRSEDAWSTMPHLRPYLDGVRSRARELGFAVDIFWAGRGGLSMSRFESIATARGIRGVVIAPPPGFMRHMRLSWDSFSCATFHHDSWRPLLHRVAVDELHKISEVLRQTARLGYRRPGLAIASKLDAKTNHAFLGRMLVAQQEMPRADRIPPLLYTGPDVSDSRPEILRWFQKHRPDCVICCDVAMLRLLVDAGVEVPAETGLVHLEIGPDVADWTGFRIDRAAIGAAAVDLVINRMVRNETGIPEDAREVLLRGSWQTGKTTRKVPPRTSTNSHNAGSKCIAGLTTGRK